MAQETQTNIEEFKEKLDKFSELAFEISEMWGNLPGDAHDELAEEYPFQNSFDEEVWKIKSWVENFKEKK